jgi:hypothetical protein
VSDADATTLNANLTEGSASSGAAGAQRGLLRPRRLAQARSPTPPAKARPGKKARKTCAATIVDSQHSQSLALTLPVTGLDNADDDNDGTGNHYEHDTGASDESNTQDEQLTHWAPTKEETPAQSGWVTPPPSRSTTTRSRWSSPPWTQTRCTSHMDVIGRAAPHACQARPMNCFVRTLRFLPRRCPPQCPRVTSPPGRVTWTALSGS